MRVLLCVVISYYIITHKKNVDGSITLLPSKNCARLAVAEQFVIAAVVTNEDALWASPQPQRVDLRHEDA
jgi:hypothetical protein